MQVTDMDDGSSVVRPDDYRLGLKWLLGLPVLSPEGESATCPACGNEVDIYGDHLLCCRRNNYYGRHFAVQESLATMAQAGGQPFVREAPLTKTNRDIQGAALRPADLLLRALQGGVDTAVDVTVVHPLQAREMPWTKEKADAFLKQAETRKTNKYRAACEQQGWAFVPAAFDSWGGVGPKAKDLLAKLLARSTGAVPLELKPLVAMEHRQRLSLALMRLVWKLLSAKGRLILA